MLTEIISDSNNYGIDFDLIKRTKIALEKGLKSQIKNIIPNLHPVDQAELIANLTKDERKDFINIFQNHIEPELLLELEENIRNEFIILLNKKILLSLLSQLEPDDITYILEDIEDNELIKYLLNNLNSKEKRELVEESLAYPEDSIGRLMSPKEFTAVPKNWSVIEVMKYIQKNKTITGDFSEIVIVDEYYKPISTVSLGYMLKYNFEKKMQDIMRDPEDLKILKVNQNQKDAAIMFTKYNLASAPVVNDSGMLIGVLYLSDVIEIIEEEVEEDLFLINNISDDSINMSVSKSALKRLPWLITTVLTTLITSLVIDSYSETVQELVEIVTLLPVLAGLGGVSGTQTLTIIVRNLATKSINEKSFFKTIFKESSTGIFNGLILSCLGFIITYLWHSNLKLSCIFSVTIIGVLCLSCLIGSMVPLILNKLKLDPAVTAGSFITTTVDVLAYSIFLFLVTKFLM